MTATLKEIHKDPEILDRAIASHERLEIFAEGIPVATFAPISRSSREQARATMGEMFSSPKWQFTVGAPMNRDERNSRG